MIREILLKYDIFEKQVSPISKLLVSGMVVYEGKQWFKVRKIATPTFHQDKLKNMLPTIQKSCNDMLSKWKTSISKEGSSELDVWPHIQTLTADVISRTAFGSSFEEGRKIFEVLREQMNLLIQALMFAYIPGWRFVPNRLNRKLKSNHHEMGELETTASLLVWTMVLLCIHPEWQERAREEFVIGNDKTYKNVQGSNPFLYRQCEGICYISPLLTRANFKEIKLGEFIIPPGVFLSLPIIFVHRDHEYWGDDAKKFNPDRFSEVVSKASKNQISFLSFGWGPRICIGQNFALLEAKLALAMILQKFTFQLSPTYVHAPTRGITVYPQHGANIILHKI
ncbi:cytochrome P450 72A15 [Citrus sinensis]|uniref:Cytochrome P450 72A15 n=1 Tax=Citrus sinensis TaxID=2711 RepID=A0ACB8M0Y2_CITSI|nr:cytochrome P450 72A15 [Citrus sinensis]